MLMDDHKAREEQEMAVTVEKDLIQRQIEEEVQRRVPKPFLLRTGLLNPSSVDSIGYLFIFVGGFLGMYRGIKNIQF